MNGILRLTLLVTLLFVDACGVVTPTPVGSIAGQIIIEGEGIGGVAVALSNGAQTATTPTGMYRFDHVDGGSYTITISGYPLDAIFDATSAAAEIVVDGQTVIVDFRGAYLRTASLMGRVAVEGHGVPAVTVRLAGMSEGLTSTDDAGQFGFRSLRAGTYSVEISDFGEVEFTRTSQSVSVAVGEPTVLSFDGTFIRRSSVSAVVSVEGERLQGITLRLTGQDTVATGVTHATGRHTFAKLRAGTYTLEISGFDADEVEFPDTIRTVTVGLDETRNTVFDGRWVRTAGIEGRVIVEGMVLAGVTVSLTGQGEDLASVTDRNGRYAFANLRAGSYAVEIDDHPEDVEFENVSNTVEVDVGEVGNADFTGHYIRTSAVEGHVIVEGEGLQGITLRLTGQDTVATGVTHATGRHTFAKLRAGTYTLEISGFDADEVEFPDTIRTVTVGLDETRNTVFDGRWVRTAGIEGRVIVEGMVLAGVTVSLTGQGEDLASVTDRNGRYAFANLRAGSYAVEIDDHPEDVEFENVSNTVEVDVGEVGNADFTGHYIRTSAVEGHVIVEGEGLAGVTVILSGGPSDERFTKMTDADGMYRFEELRPGDYTVSISDFDPRDYEFAATSQGVSVDLDETGTVSFTGVLLRTSGISGRVSVEGMGLGDIAVTLSGRADTSTMTDAGGQYAFAGLATGDYTVSITVESDAYVFDSMSTDVTVGGDESAIVNFEGKHVR